MTSIVNISEAASLALHTMVFLAREQKDRFSAREIAAKLSVSEAHLSKVLQRLAKLGYVTSVRGPGGGFTLAPDGYELSLLEIYEAIEGPLGSHDCLMSTSLCMGDNCLFGDMLVKVNNLTRKYLAETTLKDLKTEF